MIQHSDIDAATVLDIGTTCSSSFRRQGFTPDWHGPEGHKAWPPLRRFCISYAYHYTMEDISRRPDSDGLRQRVPQARYFEEEFHIDEEIEMPLPACMDDLVVPIMDEHRSKLHGRVKKALSYVALALAVGGIQ